MLSDIKSIPIPSTLFCKYTKCFCILSFGTILMLIEKKEHMREALIWTDDSSFLSNIQDNPIIYLCISCQQPKSKPLRNHSPLKVIPIQLYSFPTVNQFSSSPYLQTFVPFVPHLLLAAPTIYALQTLLSTLLFSPYFVEDVTANAALKEEAVIVFLPILHIL